MDPLTYAQIVRILHFYSYSHVRPRRRVTPRRAPRSRRTSRSATASGSRSAKARTSASAYFGRRHRRLDHDRAPLPLRARGLRHGVRLRDAARPADRRAERAERDVVVGDDVWLGARVFVGAGVTIGDGCVVSAGSVVSRDLPPYSIAVGNPARVVRRREDYAVTPKPRTYFGTRRLDPDRHVPVRRRGARLPGLDLRAHGRRRLRGRRRQRVCATGRPRWFGASSRRRGLLALDENIGFAAGVNRAAEEAEGEYLFLLNPDTVVHEGAVANLRRLRAATPRARPTAAARCVRTARSTPARAGGCPRSGASPASRPCSTWPSGARACSTRSRSAAGSATRFARSVSSRAACCSSRRGLGALGGFDLRFFMYGEDADLSIRASRRA